MAWYNPSTWTAVDNLQGQNKPKMSGYTSNTPVYIDPKNLSGLSVSAPAGSKWDTGIKDSRGGYTTLPKINTGSSPSGDTSSQDAYAALLRSWMTPTPAPVAANFDVAGAMARARQSAESSQNPLYSKYLNEFLDNSRLQQQQEQKKAEMANQGLDTTLRRSNEDTSLNRTRTTEDVTSNMNQINTAADEFQTDSGTENAIARIEESRKIAASGQTGGLANQQKEASQEARNTGEKRQTAQFDQKKAEQQILKARTFEDMGKIDVRAKEDNTTGKAKVKFDLDTYISQYGVGKDIESSGYNIKKFAQKNDEMRQAAVKDATSEYSRAEFNRFLTSLSNPGQISATLQKYGSSF